MREKWLAEPRRGSERQKKQQGSQNEAYQSKRKKRESSSVKEAARLTSTRLREKGSLVQC